MIQDLTFFISEAFIGMRRSGLMMVITIITFTISLIVLGAFMLASANITHMSDFFASRLEIRVYLKDGLTKPDIQHFQDRIEHMQAVQQVEFVDKDDAWKDFQAHFKNIELDELLTENPLPHAFKVRLTDNQYMKAMASHLESFTDFVEDVGYLELLSQRLAMFAKFTKITGLCFVLLLTFATLMIIVNTIRLTIIARQDEINIMNLVGASPQFIRWPFLIEGLIIGIIGSSVALVVLRYVYAMLVVKMQTLMPYLPIVYDGLTIMIIYGSIMAIGMALGTFGAYLSVSRTLRSTL